jgi:hypothetical protein
MPVELWPNRVNHPIHEDGSAAASPHQVHGR